MSAYASDPAAITRSANAGYTIPDGNNNDKSNPGENTNIAMGTWAGLAAKQLGLGSTPTQYAMDFAAYFATFFKVPDAPIIGAVTVGNGQASVGFAASQSDLTVTSYTVTASPGGITASGSASPVIVRGLSNGVAYTFTVKATSNAGTGKISSASKSLTPVAVQQAVAASAAPTAAAIPAAPVPKRAVSAPVVAPAVKTVAIASPLAANKMPVTLSAPVAVAVNTAATAQSTPASSLPASSLLPAPIVIAAKPGSAEARVFFSVPQSAAIIESFTVVAYTGGAATGIKASGTGSPIRVTGLINGTDYTFTVTANGRNGTKAISGASAIATPLSIFE